MVAPFRIIFALLLVCTGLRAQLLVVRSIDVSQYPQLSAKLYAFDTSMRFTPLNLTKDRLVHDNETRQKLGQLSCGSQPQRLAISGTLVFDGSTERYLRLYQDGVSSWLRYQDTTSENSIIEAGSRPYIIRDFVQEPDSLKLASTLMFPTEGTNLQRALTDSLCGAFAVVSRGVFHRTIVIVVDGHSTINRQQIDSLAQALKVTIHAVCIGISADDDLRFVVAHSGGVVLENQSPSNISQAMAVLSQISSGAPGCTIQWTTDSTLCTKNRSARFDALSIGTIATYRYTIPDSLHRHLVASISYADIGAIPDGAHGDTTVNLTAVGGVVTINDIISDNPQFEILGSFRGVTVARGFTFPITVRFNSTDDYRRFARISVITDGCDSLEIIVLANERENPALSPRLENFRGGERIFAGSVAEVQWSGVPPVDPVRLEYTIDGGNSWNSISQNATGLRTFWRCPDSVSTLCFMRIASLGPLSVFHYSDSAFQIRRPKLNVHPVQCGTVRLGEQREVVTQSVVCNTTNTLFYIDSARCYTPDFTVVSGYPNTVALSSCADLELRFQPTRIGILYDTISVYTSVGLIRIPVSGFARASLASPPDYISMGRVAIGITTDTIIHTALCRSADQIVRVSNAVRSLPDTAHFLLPEQKLSAVLTPEDPCLQLRCQYFCSQVGRFCSRILIDTDSDRYETLMYGEGICAPPQPHYGIEIPDSLKVAIGGMVDVPIQYYPAPVPYRQMKRPWTIRLRYNRTILFPMGTTPKGVDQPDSEYAVMTISGRGFEIGDTLITLHFMGTLGTSDVALMRLEAFLWRDECQYDPPLASGRIFFTNVCRAGGLREFVLNDSLVFRSVQPNPSREYAAVEFSLRENGWTSLSIVDVFGRTVREVFAEELNHGSYTASVDVRDLTPGDYYAILSTPTGRISTLIGVVR